MKNKSIILISLILVLTIIELGLLFKNRKQLDKYYRINLNKSENIQVKNEAEDKNTEQINTTLKIVVQNNNKDENEISLFDPKTREIQLLFKGNYHVEGFFGGHLILRQKETTIFFEYNFETKKLVPFDFPARKKLSEEKYQSIYLSKLFVGQDKLFFGNYTYLQTDMGDLKIDSLDDEFIYSFSDNNFVLATSFIQRGLKLLPEKENYNFFGISSDQKNMFFVKQLGIRGCVNFVAVDLEEKSFWKLLEKETSYDDPKQMECPWINDSGTKIIYRITREDGTLLQLASTESPSNFIKSILLPKSLMTHLNGSTNIFSGERNVSWLDDDSVVVSFDDGMAFVDFSNATIREIYLDETINKSYTNWDFYNFETDGNRYVAFTDWDNDDSEPCSGRPDRMCPKGTANSINKLTIIDIFSGKKYNVGDNLSFIGWVREKE
ncbi:MAG: hypothetical protein ACWGHO_02650 [Candidatus Moraniibacteriota bacterium]